MIQQPWIVSKSFRLFLIFFILTSILLAVPTYQYYRLKRFLENSAFSWGEIVAITQKEKGKEYMVHFIAEMNGAEYRSLVNYYHSGKYLFYPTIEFIDQQGNKQRFESKYDFPSNLLGSMEKVEVRYDPNNPHIAMIDTARNYRTIIAWIVFASFPGAITLVILFGVLCQRWIYRQR